MSTSTRPGPWLPHRLRRAKSSRRAVGKNPKRPSPPATPPATLTAAIPAMDPAERYRYWGNALIAIGMVLLVFAIQVLLIFPLKHYRDQQASFDSFRYDLANGTAPVGQITTDDLAVQSGTPVALITIPGIGLSDEVVYAGTTSDVTSQGPGLRRDTVLPGQKGASVLIGRASAYGAPFGNLASIKIGETITTTTGQGIATYSVTNVRRGGDALPEPITTEQGRLTLVSSYAPIPYVSTGVIRVDATLSSPAFVTPVSVVSKATLGSNEETLAGDMSALPWLIITLVGICAAAILITLGARYWGRWQAWIVGFPVLLLLSTIASQQAMTLLPNTL